MGISWSSNRRRNSYYQNPPPQLPPQPQYIASSHHYYSSDHPSLSPPPPPPAPPPPPPPLPPPPPGPLLTSSSSSSFSFSANNSNYPYANTATPYAQQPRGPYPAYPLSLPPPPPPPQTHYCYGHYSSCNHANSAVGRFSYNYNYQPYYAANQANGWPAIRPPVGPVPPSRPYVEHQNAKKVKNDVNVHKDTLRLEIDELNSDQHLVSFVFDAMYDGR